MGELAALPAATRLVVVGDEHQVRGEVVGLGMRVCKELIDITSTHVIHH